MSWREQRWGCSLISDHTFVSSDPDSKWKPLLVISCLLHFAFLLVSMSHWIAAIYGVRYTMANVFMLWKSSWWQLETKFKHWEFFFSSASSSLRCDALEDIRWQAPFALYQRHASHSRSKIKSDFLRFSLHPTHLDKHCSSQYLFFYLDLFLILFIHFLHPLMSPC